MYGSDSNQSIILVYTIIPQHLLVHQLMQQSHYPSLPSTTEYTFVTYVHVRCNPNSTVSAQIVDDIVYNFTITDLNCT